MTQATIKVAVTGAAGQISYSLLFRIASGSLFGADQPIALSLLEIPQALDALGGVAMELNDCAFPLVRSIELSADPEQAFGDIDYAFLVGARPRGPGMERKDLLEANAQIFSVQGKALNAAAKKSVRVLVVGNPANTNALITQSNAPDIPVSQFAAMMRLDHNRAISLLADKTGAATTAIAKPIIWGNHSATQYPDLHHASVKGTPALSLVERSWYENDYIPQVQQRGAAIIQARGASSAASAASAAVDHMRDLAHGAEWTSMAVLAPDNPYQISGEVFYSFPVACKAGNWSLHKGLEVSPFSHDRMQATERELIEERDAIRHLLVS